MDDKAVVDLFISHLRENGHVALRLDSRPDLDNRNSSDIDAIAGNFAIEHTSVDTIENQRRDGKWFSSVADPLEDQFRNSLRFRLRLIFPYDGIAKGQDWDALREALASWISSAAGALADGSHEVAIQGIPFNFHVTKDSTGRPGLFFLRIDPGDTTLASRVLSHLSRKAEKLLPIRSAGKTTVLLVDSSDIALMSHGKMLEAIREAFGGLPGGVDQLWYVDTSISPDLEFWDLTPALEHAV
jgi:hypothetical protein